MPATRSSRRRASAAPPRRAALESRPILAPPGQDRRGVVRRRAAWLLLAALLVIVGGAAAVAAAQPSPVAPNPCLQSGPRPPQCLPDPSYTGPPQYPTGTPPPVTGTSQPCLGPLPCPSTSTTTSPTTPSDPCRTTMPGQPRPAPCSPTSTPTSPSAAPTTTLPPVPPSSPSGGECGITNIGACVTDGINSFFWALVVAALNSLLRLVGQTLLATPTLDQLPRISELWESSRGVAVAAYVLLIMVAGVVLMAYESMQARTTIRQIAPRIAVGFLAANLSLILAAKAIELANALSYALLGGGVDPSGAAQTLSALLTNVVMGSITGTGFFGVLISLGLVVLLIALVGTYVVRVAVTAMLLAGAPLFLVCHGLEQTDGIARWWWRAFFGVLAIQLGQSLALITALRVFFAEGGFTIFGPTPDGVINLIATGGLLWILVKIPGWVMHHIQLGGGRRSLLGSMIRAFLMYKAFGLVRGAAATGARPSGGGGQGGGGRGGGGGGGPTGPADPYASPRATSSGQYVLPLTGLRRHRASRPGPSAPPPTPAAASRRARQLALPFEHGWPEHRPILGSNGQYRLPLDVERVKTTTPRATTSAPPRGAGFPTGAARRRATQLELPFDPYKNNRPTRSGQYPLPLDGLRRVPHQPSTPPPASPPTRNRVVQPELPFDPYKGNRATRSGQYPLPLEGLRRVPPATPSPAPSAAPCAARPAPRAGRQLRLPLDLPAPPRRTPPPKSGGKS